MKDPNIIEELDFEIISGPSTTPVHTPPASVQETSEPDQPIAELFDQHRETDRVQDAAKIIIKLSLPFAVAWATFVSVLRNVYKRDSEERLLEHVSEDIQPVFNSYRRRIHWVDENLPDYATKYKSNLVKALTDAKSSIKRSLTDEPCRSIPKCLTRGLFYLGIYMALQLIFPPLRRGVRIRLPLCGFVWIPISMAIAYAFRSKRCQRRSFKGKLARKDK